jgi:hypothetical protein
MLLPTNKMKYDESSKLLTQLVKDMNSHKSLKLGTDLLWHRTYSTVEFSHVFGVGDIWCIWRKYILALGFIKCFFIFYLRRENKTKPFDYCIYLNFDRIYLATY